MTIYGQSSLCMTIYGYLHPVNEYNIYIYKQVNNAGESGAITDDEAFRAFTLAGGTVSIDKFISNNEHLML